MWAALRTRITTVLAKFRVARLSAWAVVTSLLFISLYPAQFSLIVIHGEDLVAGTSQKTFPIAALFLVAFFLFLRRHDLVPKRTNGSFRRHLVTRLFGLAIIMVPMLYLHVVPNTLEFSMLTFAIVCYGTAVLLMPSSMRLLGIYTSIYSAAVALPVYLMGVIGSQLAEGASILSKDLTSVTGMAVNWQGDSFLFVHSGSVVLGTITPGCASLSSIAVFLLILSMMHLDLKGPLTLTAATAALGTLALFLLNALRIVLIIAAGYLWGLGAFLAAHTLLEYPIFVLFYLVVAIAYMRATRPMADGGHSFFSTAVRMADVEADD